jgi:hypothetical protein
MTTVAPSGPTLGVNSLIDTVVEPTRAIAIRFPTSSYW